MKPLTSPRLSCTVARRRGRACCRSCPQRRSTRRAGRRGHDRVIAAPPVAGATPVASRSALERALCLFTDVQPGEGVTALVMFANVFLILCAYYFVKPLRDGWLASSDGRGLSTMEMKAYTSFAQSVVLIGV